MLRAVPEGLRVRRMTRGPPRLPERDLPTKMEGGSSPRRTGLAVTTASVFWVFSNVCSVKTAQYNLLTGQSNSAPWAVAQSTALWKNSQPELNADFAISKRDLSK